MNPSSARHRLDAALARIDNPAGEGARACLTVYRDNAVAEAEAADARSQVGQSRGPLDGAIVSIKDLFDVAGEVTRAGSRILAEEGKPAAQDAPVVQRLRAAGAVIVAKTNMTEFAFSGVGTNPHYGTPGMPADRARVPGGSSSGAAVAVADGMCEIAIGSDTGGSTRIPAALCGVVGFKPSKPRVPTQGVFPLSTTLDSIGPLATTVAQCAVADAVMAGEAPQPLAAMSLSDLRCGIVQGFPLDDLDEIVAAAFERSCVLLARAGVHLDDDAAPLLDDMRRVNARGAIVPYEAYQLHRDRLERRFDDIDRKIAARIKAAETISADDYAWMLAQRARLVRAMDERIAAAFDVLALPTVPIVAPTIAEVEDDETFARRNARLLRNPSFVNFFDLCAVSLPMPGSALPSGLMLVARHGQDRRLLAIAAAVERLFASAG
jgi:aspartyl-tRNA(Asn)/glutamyl-tRNA(Gln) amidotransferase subunit A